MSNYVIASNGQTMASMRYYDNSKIERAEAGHLVYVDHTAATREYRPRRFTKRRDIGLKEQPVYKAGTVHPSRPKIQPDCLEADIHRAVIRYIKKEHPCISKFIVPGIGEFCGRGPVSIMESGYVKGQPDIMIPVGNGKFTGLCIELKKYASKPSKRGKLSKEQAEILNQYASIGYKTLATCDFNEVTDTIDEYVGRLELVNCSHCKSEFLSKKLLKTHLMSVHKTV